MSFASLTITLEETDARRSHLARMTITQDFVIRNSLRNYFFLPHVKKGTPRRTPPEGQTSPNQPRADHAARRAARADRQRAQSNGSTPARHPNDSTDGNGKAKTSPRKKPEPGQPARRNQARATRRRAATSGGNGKTDQDDGGAPGTNEAGPPEQQPDTAGDNGQKPPAQARAGSPGNRNQAATQQRHRGRNTREAAEPQAHTAEHLHSENAGKNDKPRKAKPPHGAPHIPRPVIGDDAARDWRGISSNYSCYDNTPDRAVAATTACVP